MAKWSMHGVAPVVLARHALAYRREIRPLARFRVDMKLACNQRGAVTIPDREHGLYADDDVVCADITSIIVTDGFERSHKRTEAPTPPFVTRDGELGARGRF